MSTVRPESTRFRSPVLQGVLPINAARIPAEIVAQPAEQRAAETTSRQHRAPSRGGRYFAIVIGIPTSRTLPTVLWRRMLSMMNDERSQSVSLTAKYCPP